MNKLKFIRIARFKYENNYYQMYKTNKNKIAFLKNNDIDKYEFPSYEDFCKLVYIFSSKHDSGKMFFENGTHRNFKFIPKIKGTLKNKTVLVMITSSLILSALTGCSKDSYNSYATSGVNRYGVPIDDEYISQDIDTDTDIEYDSDVDFLSVNFYENEDFEIYNVSKFARVYNNKYFDTIFGVENYTIDDIVSTINNNSNIPNKYKDFMIDFYTKMNSYYDNLDLRILNYNLKNLEFEEKDPSNSDFLGGVAYYDYESNKIVLQSNIDLINDGKSKVTFRHELGHIFTNLIINKGGYDIKYNFFDGGEGKHVDEALNVIFTTEPFLDEYDDNLKQNLGYPIITNELRIITESIGYDIAANRTNNIYTFEKALGDYLPNELDPKIVDQLISFQWIQYSIDSIEVDDSDYIDLYSYIAKLYIKSHINSNMTYEEINTLKDNLINDLLRGVKDESYVYINIVEDEFNKYLSENNIESQSRGR